MTRSLVPVIVLVAGCTFAPNTANPPGGGTTDAAGAPPVHDAVPAHDDAARGDAEPAPDAAAAASGHLSATVALIDPEDIDLSSEGSADWAHWGYTSGDSFDHAAGADLLSNAAISGSSQLGVTSVAVTASWNNGTPDASASQTGTGTGTQSPGAFTFTAPAGVAGHLLRVYVGGNDGGQGKLTASLSDDSATAYTNDQSNGDSAWHAVYAITYNAGSADQQLSVTWADAHDATDTGFVMLLSATLQ